MYKLYGSLGSGSASVEAALAAAGADYKVVAVNTGDGQHLTDEYKSINPRQQVPALQLPDGSVMTEGSAMMLHISDAFPQAELLAKPGSPMRAQQDRWLVFMAVNVYEGELRKAYADRYTDDAGSVEGTRSNADAYVKRHYEILEAAAVGPYFFGETFSMVDLYLWMLACWMDPEWLVTHTPKISALALNVSQRPRVVSIHKAHFG